MRQAGRYLPEYRALRQSKGGFMELLLDPEGAAEVTLQPVRRFRMDAAILFSDILVVPWALGQGLRFEAGEGPVLPPIRDADGVAALDAAGAPARWAPVLETVGRVRAGLPEGAALIGFAGGPFTVACYMVEGGGSKDFTETRLMAWRDPALFARLIHQVEAATLDYLVAQAEAGAEALMIFESWAGVLPPSQFRTHVIGPTGRIVEALRERFPDLPVIGFPRLAGTLLGAYARGTEVDAVALDTSVDSAEAARVIPRDTALQGNLDPLCVVAGGPAMREEARRIALALRGRPHVFNLGHGLIPQTPPEHVADLVAALRATT
jgi:uroporphyrinogen decarboxylase